MTIIDLAEAIAPGAELDEIGIRPGEKLHEEMISEDDAPPDDRAATTATSSQPTCCGSWWLDAAPTGKPVAATASPTAPTPTTSGSTRASIRELLADT